ncbi:hypothetical protein [uncultured Mediterranean phage uvMED]|nr:hypothetical protein [uncultured Mediterranean phage uvMED]|tara:strand:- start:9043 stop:9369 length:327 start_codon:yes stop_codon:yes gene_type:complete
MATTKETVTETVTDPPVKNTTPIADKVTYLRFWARVILSIMVLCIYFFVIYSLFGLSDSELSDSTRSILQIVVGALTMVISSISQYYWASSESEVPQESEKQEKPKTN